MAKKKTKKKTNKKAKKRASNMDLAVVAIIILSILLCVLIYGNSGIVGVKLNEILGGMMGIIKYILPIGTFLIGIKLALDDDEYLTSKLTQYTVLLISVAVLMSAWQINSGEMSISNKTMQTVVKEAYNLGTQDIGGGALGVILAMPLSKLLSPIGAIILCIGVVIMLAVFTFGINISEIINNFVEKTEENREEKYERRQQLREEQKKARMEAKQESIENRKKAKELQKEYNIDIFKADISNSSEIKKLTNYVLNKYKKIDVLINNAGISQTKMFTDITDDDWNLMINTNLYSCFKLTQNCLTNMIHNKSGCIINISSMWGQVGSSCESLYSITKAGIDAMTKSLAKELGPSGIRVNSIAPGFIDTDMNKCYTKEDVQNIINDTPLEKIGQASDISKCIKWLIEDNFTTGQIIPVNGGLIIN